MRNNLKNLWQGTGPVEDILLKAGINPTARPEEISLEKFAALYGMFGETE
ncbi:MAG: hypothetical protein HQK86_08960 [Nitrospinae bacterium]|nr:hypothetical protein [Nitrospinota bacterium]